MVWQAPGANSLRQHRTGMRLPTRYTRFQTELMARLQTIVPSDRAAMAIPAGTAAAAVQRVADAPARAVYGMAHALPNVSGSGLLR
jgi:hypothetical protein